MPEPVHFALEKDNGTVRPWVSYDYFRKVTKKQALPVLHYPNFAIQGATREVIARFDGFMGERCGYVEMTREEAVDIDTEQDVAWAEFLVEKGYVQS